MNEYVTDEEQVERIKQWWTDNGSSVIFGLIIGVGGIGGWKLWTDYSQNIAAEASAHFTKMVSLVESKSIKEAIDEGDILLDDYARTPYAELARLTLAKVFVEDGKYDQAASQLQSLVRETSEQPIEMLARQRLAAVQLQQQKMDEALKTLSVEYPAHFAAAFEELKGDILVAQGKTVEAGEAYQRAQLAKPASANPQFLQKKMEDLGITAVSS